MLDRATPTEANAGEVPRRALPRWSLGFLGIGGLLGAAGVVVAAAGAHVGGGDLARTSSEFLLVHAAAVVGGAGGAPSLSGRPAGLLAAALALLALGAALFGGELACAALLDWRPVPLGAPAGGICLVAGWLGLVAAAVARALERG